MTHNDVKLLLPFPVRATHLDSSSLECVSSSVGPVRRQKHTEKISARMRAVPSFLHALNTAKRSGSATSATNSLDGGSSSHSEEKSCDQELRKE